MHQGGRDPPAQAGLQVGGEMLADDEQHGADQQRQERSQDQRGANVELPAQVGSPASESTPFVKQVIRPDSAKNVR